MANAVSPVCTFESHYTDRTRGWGSRSAGVGIPAGCRKGAGPRACRSGPRSKPRPSSEGRFQRV